MLRSSVQQPIQVKIGTSSDFSHISIFHFGKIRQQKNRNETKET